MVADFILQLLGNNPAAYSEKSKWPTIFADLVDLLVPVVMTLLFLAPFGFVYWRKRTFTAVSFLTALAIGVALASGVWWLNELSYGYGQAVIFREIYGS